MPIEKSAKDPPVEDVDVYVTAPGLPADELGLEHWQAPFTHLWKEAMKSVVREVHVEEVRNMIDHNQLAGAVDEVVADAIERARPVARRVAQKTVRRPRRVPTAITRTSPPVAAPAPSRGGRVVPPKPKKPEPTQLEGIQRASRVPKPKPEPEAPTVESLRKKLRIAS